ncbi:hypothetical protein [Nostoc sp. FACHB-892]|nr:hypothetical protein [Nostoc sp. FACHB-892]
MMQSLWFFGSYLTILADRTTTGGHGVTILGIQADQVEWARLYMEPV